MTITLDNWHISTKGDWKPMAEAEARNLLRAWELAKSKTFKTEDGSEWICEHLSQGIHRSRSRGFSLYLRKKGGTVIHRISDHWSNTGEAVKRSQKMNCGWIASCVWNCKKANKAKHLFNAYIDGFNPKYPSRLLGATINKNKLTQITG